MLCKHKTEIKEYKGTCVMYLHIAKDYSASYTAEVVIKWKETC